MKRTILTAATLLFTLALAVPQVALADDEEAGRKRALALKVMEVTGATAQSKQVAESMLAPLRPYFPTVPEEMWTDLGTAFDVDQIVELSLPIYTRNFSEEELKGLIEFYQSTLGKKVIERMPLVMQESMVSFNNWQQQKLGAVVQTLKEKGYEPVDPSSPHGASPHGPQAPTP